MNNTALQELRGLMKPQNSGGDKLALIVAQAFDVMMNQCRRAAREQKCRIRDYVVEFDGIDDTDPLSLEIICDELVKKCQKEQLKASYAKNLPGQIWVEWAT